MTLNLLIAYPAFQPSVIAALEPLGDNVRLLIDSGAFTAFNSGKAIDLDAYCRFVQAPPLRLWRFFNLDVIGDAAGSARNLAVMRGRGLAPVPVFTRGATLDELDEMFSWSDLVAIGGLVVRPYRPPQRYLKAVMQHVAGRHVHLLGFVRPEWVTYLKPYSCDATSWKRVTRFGQIDIYIGHGEMIQYTSRQARLGPPPPAAMDAIAALGIDPYSLQRDVVWNSGGAGEVISMSSWMRFSLDMERTLGVKLFLASDSVDVPHLAACYRFLTEGGDIREVTRRPGTKWETAA